MEPNYAIFFAAALIPLVIKEVWYHQKVFGPALAKAAGLAEAPPRKMNRILELVLTYVLGLIITFTISGMVIHQTAVLSLLVGIPEFQDPNSEVSLFYADFMDTYGDLHRTFGHGALHGSLAGLLFVTPILAILGFTEQKGFRYLAIHGGFWIICFFLMGGLVCAYA